MRLGLAGSTKEYTGHRASTVYSITDAVREALAAWLAEPGAPPATEFEALLKVAFADNGSLTALRTNLAAIRAHAESELEYQDTRRREYAESGGPYPDRLPVISIAMRYFQEQTVALLRWVEWAEQAICDWQGVTPESGAVVPPGAFDPPDSH